MTYRPAIHYLLYMKNFYFDIVYGFVRVYQFCFWSMLFLSTIVNLNHPE